MAERIVRSVAMISRFILGRPAPWVRRNRFLESLCELYLRANLLQENIRALANEGHVEVKNLGDKEMNEGQGVYIP